jgi:putative peptidoglycan lipid II flippase
MSSKLKNIFLVSGTTVLSRISGFARDALFFRIFGTSGLGAAFLFAFAIPNLFRRLLGEGALSSAVVPILAKLYVEKNQAAVVSLSKAVIVRLLIVLAIVTAIGCSIAYFATACTAIGEKWMLTFHFLLLTLPYVIFVCIASIISATLNVFNRFIVASLNPVWLNISMITALIVGQALRLSDVSLLDCLSLGVIVGGILQCAVPFFVLRKIDSEVDDPSSFSDEISEILRLFWPGLLGAAVSQINLLISRSLAYLYCASAVSILYLANRLTELPLGVFGASISTVVFPDMSKLSTDDNLQNEFNQSFNRGLFSLLWILLPSSVGLCMIGRELLSVFFECGAFSHADTDKILPVLVIYCASIPFFGISNFMVRGFHAIKDTKTPTKIGICVMLINFLLTISLTYPLGVNGIAAATTLSVMIQALILYIKLSERHGFHLNISKKKLAKIALGLVLMVACVRSGQAINAAKYDEYGRQAIRTIAIYVPFAAAVYVLASTYPLKILQKKHNKFPC